jgi:predicted TIM-barrel fold metal-dependent hydrolase
MRIADSHVHAWPVVGAEPPVRDRPGWADLRSALDLGKLVARVVLVTPGSPPGDDEWTLDTAGRHRTSVRAVLRASALSQARAEHCCGIRLVLDPDRASAAESSVAEAADQGVSVSVQNATGDWEAPARWAAQYSGVTFVVDHLGHPDVSRGVGTAEWQTFLALAAHPNVVVKMPNLAYFTRGFEHHQALAPFVREVLTVYEPGRVLWASDWPNTGSIPYAQLLQAGIELVHDVDDDAVTAVFQDNAVKLFWTSSLAHSAKTDGLGSPPRRNGAPV